MEVFKSMGAVQKELSTMGIGKNGRNERQRFDFRKIDDLYNVLGPLLAKHDLLIIPNTLKSECKTLTSSNGTPVYMRGLKMNITLFLLKMDQNIKLLIQVRQWIHTIKD